MKLYFFPGSTACRPVELFLAEAGIQHEAIMIDIMSGKQHEKPYCDIAPNGHVPAIDDNGFVLTESSAILKYLADKVDSPMYPKDLKKRAKVNEAIDWFNTQLYREYLYHFVYAQTLPYLKLEPADGQRNLIARGKERAMFYLSVLNDKQLGDGRKFVCGNEITIADCFAMGALMAGAWIGQTFERYPNVDRLVATMKARPSWQKVEAGLQGLVDAFSGGTYTTIGG